MQTPRLEKKERKEGVAERNHYRLNTTPIPMPLHCLGVGNWVEELETKEQS